MKIDHIIDNKSISNNTKLLQHRMNVLSMLDIWTVIYLLIIYILTFMTGSINVKTFALLVVFAVPFINKMERLLEVCIVVSPIAYFFVGADEAIMSIYTIFVLFSGMRFVAGKKIRRISNLLPRLALIVVFLISYKFSLISYSTGLFGLIYVVIISLFLSYFADIDYDKPLKGLPSLAMVSLIIYSIIIIVNPYTIYGRYSISSDVNMNTFGLAVALMTIIVASDLFINTKKRYRILKIGTCGLGVIMIFLAGSRNALMAAVGAVLIIILIKGYREKKVGKALLAIISIALFSLVIVNVVLGSGLDIDVSRLNISSVVESGGTNRVHIWTEVIPYVFNNYRWFGYGPGKNGSTLVLQQLVQRTYSHTHNTLVEAFAETGLCGFILVVIVIVGCLKNINGHSKENNSWYLPYALFLGVLISSIGESYYNDIVFWIYIGILSIPLRKKNNNYKVW